ncbi:hypothetical protein MBLNU457_6544t3 [Dothideomycetes sp. NU457]
MNTISSSHGSTSRTSSTPASSSLRPRAPRLISGLDEGDEVAFDPTTAPIKRIASPAQTPIGSRSASPLPNKHPSRSASAFGESRTTPSRNHAVFAGSQSNKSSTTSLVNLWGTSWTAIQGIAADLMGNDADVGSPDRTSRRRKNSTSGTRRPAQSIPRSWGPPQAHPLPATTSIATGTREERESLVRAQKRKEMLVGSAVSHKDALGRHKRRTSDAVSVSAPPGANEDRDALVYIHHVKPSDTLAGITIKYNCSAQTLRKANRMWPNDSVQSKKVLVLPVDGCGAKGRKINDSERLDLLSGSPEDQKMAHSPKESKTDMATRLRNESISTQGERPSSSAISTISEAEAPWTHDSWVLLPNSDQPTEIARLSRRSLGYFPPTRRKSQSYSDLDTPSTSLDLNRAPFFDPTTLSPVVQEPPQRPHRPRTLSNSANGYFPSYLAGPGGVGTMNKNVKSPGPAQDGLNKLFASRLPNVAPPPNQHQLYMPDIPLYSDNPSGTATPAESGAQTPNMNLEQMGATVETWFRNVASKAKSAIEAPDRRDPARASVGVPGRGAGGIGDLIEMADSFAIGGDEEDEQEEARGRQGSAVGPTSGPSAQSGSNYGHERLRDRGRGVPGNGPVKRAKDD